MNSGLPFVHLDRVSLIYQGREAAVHALEETNIDINTGEFIAVVGPSGCGKSSLLKLVAGLHPATTGRIIVADQEVTGPIKISGMAFQNATLLPWRTTLDNVLLPLEIVEPHASQFRANRGKYQAMANDLWAWSVLGLRTKVPMGAFRRHAAAQFAVPRADPRTADAVARRAVRRARRLHARGFCGRSAKAVAQQEADGDPGYARPARSRLPCRHDLRHERAPGAHRVEERGQAAATAHAGRYFQAGIHRNGAPSAKPDRETTS